MVILGNRKIALLCAPALRQCDVSGHQYAVFRFEVVFLLPKDNFWLLSTTENMSANELGAPSGDDGIVGGPRTPQQVAAQKRLQQTQAQVDEVVDIMKTNVEKVLERDQKLSELDDRADALQQGASQFEQQAGKLKRKFWLQNLKMMIIMGVIGLVILIIIIMKFMPDSTPQPQYAPPQVIQAPPPAPVPTQAPAAPASG